ncbi:WxcM-like protein [Pontibacter ummariensis]|uniref:WxcM-like, C-terminal n=1 Tax=Pontibacter ummariensis TaxID=1610492 RepID=A0A239EA62_9BACT|nr:FdtA/QdtA family cupin domain-containing protein [Pontibacter ummariensis]PRY13145.1 WxcM-like protein [Pontibacter ummariensis]SNS41168.1 WxcM-like, C-terminal [Pontibacter ummariensis]
MTVLNPKPLPANPYLIPLERMGSPEEGFLTSTQLAANVPFKIKRVFWTHDIPMGVTRGNHANKATEEVLIAISGKLQVKVDTGNEVYVFDLSDSRQGVYIPAMCWTELQFSEGAIALCLASTDYDEKDYIRDYAYFKQLANHLAL